MLSPKDVVAPTPEETAQFDAWEKKIDAALRTFEGRTVVDCAGLSGRVLSKVLNAYRVAGWHVAHSVDPREGPFLTFMLPSDDMRSHVGLYDR